MMAENLIFPEKERIDRSRSIISIMEETENIMMYVPRKLIEHPFLTVTQVDPLMLI